MRRERGEREEKEEVKNERTGERNETLPKKKAQSEKGEERKAGSR